MVTGTLTAVISLVVAFGAPLETTIALAIPLMVIGFALGTFRHAQFSVEVIQNAALGAVVSVLGIAVLLSVPDAIPGGASEVASQLMFVLKRLVAASLLGLPVFLAVK